MNIKVKILRSWHKKEITIFHLLQKQEINKVNGVKCCEPLVVFTWLSFTEIIPLPTKEITLFHKNNPY